MKVNSENLFKHKLFSNKVNYFQKRFSRMWLIILSCLSLISQRFHHHPFYCFCGIESHREETVSKLLLIIKPKAFKQGLRHNSTQETTSFIDAFDFF